MSKSTNFPGYLSEINLKTISKTYNYGIVQLISSSKEESVIPSLKASSGFHTAGSTELSIDWGPIRCYPCQRCFEPLGIPIEICFPSTCCDITI
jgi:hypothetical protein